MTKLEHDEPEPCDPPANSSREKQTGAYRFFLALAFLVAGVDALQVYQYKTTPHSNPGFLFFVPLLGFLFFTLWLVLACSLGVRAANVATTTQAKLVALVATLANVLVLAWWLYQ